MKYIHLYKLKKKYTICTFFHIYIIMIMNHFYHITNYNDHYDYFKLLLF